MQEEDNINEHVRSYLNYYINQVSNPRFAVLVSGPWGVGKTHIVRNTLRSLRIEDVNLNPFKTFDRRPLKVANVSLYGVSDQSGFDNALLAAIYPWSSHKASKAAGAITKSALKYLKISPPELSKNLFKTFKKIDVFVFDDLERATIPPTELMGNINSLVEHDGAKAIILANETEINDPNYAKIKEKLVGITLKITPEINYALHTFISRLSLTDREFAREAKLRLAIIRQTFDDSEYENLRSLERGLFDLQRLYDCLDEKHKISKELIDTVFQLYLMMAMEIRSSLLNEKSIRSRSSQRWAGMFSREKEGPLSPFTILTEKYSGIDVFDPVLSDDTIADGLCRGLISTDKVFADLDTSSYFASDEEPEWRTVWYAHERETGVVEEAIVKMDGKFNKYEYRDPGIILHVFGQYLWLASIGYRDFDKKTVLGWWKEYVVDLRERGELEPPSTNIEDDYGRGAYKGLGFYGLGTEEFTEFWKHLEKERERADQESYPKKARELLNLIRQDFYGFRSSIRYSSEGSGDFARKPILSAVDPNEFASILVDLPAAKYRDMIFVLRSRYDGGIIHNDLKDEKEWLFKVFDAIKHKAEGSSVLEQDRLVDFFETALLKNLGLLDASQ